MPAVFYEVNAKSVSGVDIESNVRKMFLLEAKVEILDYDRKVLFMAEQAQEYRLFHSYQ